MREIKFRVFEDGVFNYFTLNNILTYHDVFSRCIINGEIFEQFTGLNDKNGKEIYEGDIIKAEEVVDRGDGDYDPMIGEVVFYDSAFQVKDNDDYHSYYWFTEIDSEIIGNIHENPELLK